jgi:hypothetical protein
MSTPKIFICPFNKDKLSIDDPLTEKNEKTASPKYFSDFYTDPSAGALISYSFISPYSPNWTTNAKPGYIIGADENNGSDPTSNADRQEKTGTHSNSTNHNGEGQNILCIDMSVTFVKSPYAGINNDNIYTALPDNYTGRPDATPGILSVRTQSKEDTVLIPIQEKFLTHWDRKIKP